MTTPITTELTSQDIPTKSRWTPNALDRCDRCGQASQAYTRASKGDFELLLCGHHTHQHELALTSDGWTLDIRLDVLEDQAAKYKQVAADDDNF